MIKKRANTHIKQPDTLRYHRKRRKDFISMLERREIMKETIKERVIDSMFDRWCGQTDYDADARAATEKAVKEPTEDTIFQVAATTEARAYKEGFRDCLELIKALFC